MHPRQQAPAAHTHHAGRVVKTGGNTCITTLHRLQRHRAEAHQVGPDNAHRRGGDPVAHVGLGGRHLQPAHRQQQAHHNHRARHGIPQAGQLHHRAGHPVAGAAARKRKEQRQHHGQHGADAAQAQAVGRPLQKTVPRQHRPVGGQRAQHEQHRRHKPGQHREHTQHPGQPQAAAREKCGLRLGRPGPCAPAHHKPHAPLGPLLQPQQQRHHGQQHGGQLGGGHPVVHRQPGFVDPCGEGLDAEVTRHTKVGKGLHQRQRHTGRHGGPGQRQRHLADAARQRGTHQACSLHQVGGAFTQCGAGQQIHIRVKREHKHPGRTAHAAHLGQQLALQPEGGT